MPRLPFAFIIFLLMVINPILGLLCVEPIWISLLR